MSYVKIRTAIILVGMIVLPVVAVVGFKFPGSLVPGSETAKSPERPAEPSPKHPIDVADQHAISRPPQSVSPAVAAAGTSAAPPIAPPLSNSPVDDNVVFAGGAALGFPPSAVQPAANFDVRPFSPDAPSSPGVSGVRPLPAGLPALSLASSQPAPPAGPIATPGGDPFAEIQSRLKAQGATYYALETWGNDGTLFRFHCRMATSRDAVDQRVFEATDSSAVGAMQSVLDDVEAWKQGRLP